MGRMQWQERKPHRNLAGMLCISPLNACEASETHELETVTNVSLITVSKPCAAGALALAGADLQHQRQQALREALQQRRVVCKEGHPRHVVCHQRLAARAARLAAFCTGTRCAGAAAQGTGPRSGGGKGRQQVAC